MKELSLEKLIELAKKAILSRRVGPVNWDIDNIKRIDLGEINGDTNNSYLLTLENAGVATLYKNDFKEEIKTYRDQRLKDLYSTISGKSDSTRIPSQEELATI